MQSGLFMRRLHGCRQPEHQGQSRKGRSAGCRWPVDLADEEGLEGDDQEPEEPMAGQPG